MAGKTWFINIVAAQTKQSAKDAVAADQQVTDGLVPAPVLAVIDAAIDALPDLSESTISIASNGHFNDDEVSRGTSNMMVNVQSNYQV